MARKAQATRPPLEPARIYSTALTLIGEHGVEALSMRKLAASLGVDAMSIYHHVQNKQALLLGVYQRVLEELPLPPAADVPWQEALRSLGQNFYLLACRYPEVFRHLLSSPYATPREHEIYRYIRDTLRRSGLGERDRARCSRAIYTFAIGLATVAPSGLYLRPLYGEASSPGRSDLQGPTDADIDFGLEMLLAGIERRLQG